MKKLLPLICLICAVMACNQHPKTEKASTKIAVAAVPALTIERYTLNGYTAKIAAKLVKNYRDNREVGPGTSVHFSLDDLKKIRDLLDKKGGDGVRIYYAKDDNGKFVVVLMPTFSNGVSTNDSRKSIHQDFFIEQTDIVSALRNGEPAYQGSGSNPGIRMYTDPSICDNSSHCIHPDFVDCSTTMTWINNYTQLPPGTKNTTDSEWFDSCLISDFIQVIGSGNGGVRVYFANKKDAVKPEEPNRFVFTVTKKNSSGVYEDVMTCISTPKCKIKYQNKGQSFFDEGGAYDNGEQCPNNCEGSTW